MRFIQQHNRTQHKTLLTTKHAKKCTRYPPLSLCLSFFLFRFLPEGGELSVHIDTLTLPCSANYLMAPTHRSIAVGDRFLFKMYETGWGAYWICVYLYVYNMLHVGYKYAPNDRTRRRCYVVPSMCFYFVFLLLCFVHVTNHSLTYVAYSIYLCDLSRLRGGIYARTTHMHGSFLGFPQSTTAWRPVWKWVACPCTYICYSFLPALSLQLCTFCTDDCVQKKRVWAKNWDTEA